ncbi:MAG: NADPH-dependent FMN reductase [Holophaga sp.]|jgi:NAD(P)H-dependent FMN reductase
MKIAVLGGSLRKESLNRRLLGHLARTLEGLGHEVRAVSGEALRLPLYDADLPAPPEVLAVRDALTGVQGLVIVSPEYNAGIPPHLKNAVDWMSTLSPNPLKGLPVLLAAASPGAFGGSRGMVSWRATLANLGALAAPGAITVPLADRNLDAEGAPVEERARTEIQRALGAFLELAGKLG